MNIFFSFVLVCLIASPVLASDIYHYRDANGRLIVVDDPELIPSQYRGEQVAAPTTQGISSPDWSSDSKDVEDEIAIDTVAPEETAVKIVGNQVIVPVTLEHRNKEITVELILDTGASVTLLDRDAVERLRLKKWRSSTARLANGAKVDFELSQLDQLSVGPLHLEKLKVAVIDRENKRHLADGLLGMDVLKYRPYHIDYERQRLIWQ